MGREMAVKERVADPYHDLDVIDSRAPRFNQATIGLLATLAVVAGWWWLLALLGLQLAVGLTLGRRFCLPCLAYFELVQPIFGEGPLEDSRPPRFANMVGAVFLTAAATSWALGFATVGAARSVCSSPRWRCSPRQRDSARLRGVQARIALPRAPVRLLSAAAPAGTESLTGAG